MCFSHNIKPVSEENVSQLINWFEIYFQKNNNDMFIWIKFPFKVKNKYEFTSVE